MLVDAILRQAKIKPNVIAMMDKEKSTTYLELQKEVSNRMKMILELDVKEEEAIGLLFPNSVEGLIWMLALAKMGHTAILFGAKMKESEVNYHINRIGLSVLIADSRVIKDWNLNKAEHSIVGIETSVILRVSERKSTRTSVFEKGDFICHFTSGTEGEPKAVIRTLEAVESEIIDTNASITISEEQTFLTIPPICHSFGLIAGALLPLYYGHKLILEDEFLPERVLNTLHKNKVNILFAVPYMYYLLNKRLKISKMDLSNIKMCFSAGAPMDASISDTFYRYTGVRIVQDYGSTETGVMCLNLETERLPESVGKPLVNRHLILVNEKGEEVNQRTETGEICIYSKANIRTYLYPLDLNRHKFIKGYFRTGDKGRIGPEGEVYIVGRISSIMNVAGNKVDPVEVENTIKLIPGVKEAAVVCIDDNHIGSIIKAYVATDTDLEEAYVKRFCKSQMADYKVPKAVVFVKELPRSQTGKILKRYLVKEFL